jgi:hypothetical protein
VPALFLIGQGLRIERAHVGFHKEELNETAARLLRVLGLPEQPIADVHDGAPLSKPGCGSRHLSSLTAVDAPDSPAPIDLLP